MTKPTVTDSQTRYGLFRTDAELFTVDHCLRGITYPSLAMAEEALLEMKSQLVMGQRKFICLHEIDEEEVIENAVEE